jgi:O-antigen/teichoic acid export membrane protein
MAGLLKPTLVLLAGGAVAQALPLLVGPLLTRLYSPEQFGHYTLFAAIATNVAVVACGRYEYALPLVKDESEARDLMALCLRLLVAVALASIPLAWWLRASGGVGAAWWLPLAVASGGAVQCLTMWSTRAQRFGALATARVVQYGGGAGLQALAGGMQAGVRGASQGLIVGPIFANLATLLFLRRPAPLGGWSGLVNVPRAAWRAVAQKHRNFPLLNTPHAFLGALQDTIAVLLIAWWIGDAAAGFWGLALRYLKAPATLVGSAVSQALYPQLGRHDMPQARQAVRQVMWVLGAMALPLVLVLVAFGPDLFALLFGERWRGAGELSRALAPYIGVHFVASPLAVVTLAWNAQGWALRLAMVGQAIFLVSLALGLWFGGLQGAAWGVSIGMAGYFGWYFWSLATWREALDARMA